MGPPPPGGRPGEMRGDREPMTSLEASSNAVSSWWWNCCEEAGGRAGMLGAAGGSHPYIARHIARVSKPGAHPYDAGGVSNAVRGCRARREAVLATATSPMVSKNVGCALPAPSPGCADTPLRTLR